MQARYQKSGSNWESIEFDLFNEMENGVALYRGDKKDPSNQVGYITFDRLAYIAPSEE
jgi:hypothetical protein